MLLLLSRQSSCTHIISARRKATAPHDDGSACCRRRCCKGHHEEVLPPLVLGLENRRQLVVLPTRSPLAYLDTDVIGDNGAVHIGRMCADDWKVRRQEVPSSPVQGHHGLKAAMERHPIKRLIAVWHQWSQSSPHRQKPAPTQLGLQVQQCHPRRPPKLSREVPSWLRVPLRVPEARRRLLTEAPVLFCGLSWLSRFIPHRAALVLPHGVTPPVPVWLRLTGDRERLVHEAVRSFVGVECETRASAPVGSDGVRLLRNALLRTLNDRLHVLVLFRRPPAVVALATAHVKVVQIKLDRDAAQGTRRCPG
mmetsp:Transcript_117620/g.379642  ORF Transcript_117620/g.379642 Transcript_117620/m.379642 type:complete len:308 (+) Transcript_117620:297-1220(+)